MQAATLVGSSAPAVRKAFGIVGNPILQLGGVHDAVIVAEPADEVVNAQDNVQLVPVPITGEWEEVQVRGVLLRTIPPSVFGRELLPMMSTTVANTVCADVVPLAAENVVRPDPTAPSSSAMF